MNSDALKHAIFSFIIPGLGQYLQGGKRKGAYMLVAAVALHIFIWFFMNNGFGSLLNTAYHVYAGYDAYRTHQE
jgi:membrane-bound metal-dependent hydrolase YbcI (DUF457 family)